MKITILLATNDAGHSVDVFVPSPDCTVAELLSVARVSLQPSINRILNASEKYGSQVFLTSTPEGPIRLHEERTLRDYDLQSGCKLWLMCSHERTSA